MMACLAQGLIDLLVQCRNACPGVLKQRRVAMQVCRDHRGSERCGPSEVGEVIVEGNASAVGRDIS